jgi:ferredoxin-nitrite reductase
MGDSFTQEQKQYLQGFMAGVEQRGGRSFAGKTAGDEITDDPEEAESDLADRPEAVHGTPVDELSQQERAKLEQDPMDMWETMVDYAREGEFPEGDDVFRFKSRGLFYVAPAQEAYMMRCRIPGCLLSVRQLRGIADIAREWGAGRADITTRGNLQIRQIGPEDGIKALRKLYQLGLTTKGAGADNVRNVTATPTAGFDPQELYDVRAMALSMHHYILNSRDLFGLPRKFNIAFDGGGLISVASDTNDIGFRAVEVPEGEDVEPGVYFRVRLGGAPGHHSFAEDSELLLEPDQCVAAAAAMLRVFIEHGNRTNREKARLTYLLDDWGIPAFVDATQEKLAFQMQTLPEEACRPRPSPEEEAYLGVQPTQQDDQRYIGVVVPVGRMPTDQMETLADLAETYGSGEIRMTVYQNMLLPGVDEGDVDTVKSELVDAGLHYEASTVAGGLVACTGSSGCKFSHTHTKEHALELGDTLSESVGLDDPINIHLTGCDNSCAQHYCGDIGLLGTRARVDGDTVEAYDVAFGGGLDRERGLARDVFERVPKDDLEDLLEHVLETYMQEREEDEPFHAFTRRHSADELEALFGPAP